MAAPVKHRLHGFKPQIRWIILLSVLSFLFFLPFTHAKDNSRIRVLIMKDTASFKLFIKGKYEIRSLENNKLLSSGNSLSVKVSASASGINLRESFKKKALLIHPASGYFYVNNRSLRGDLIIRKEAASEKLSAINYIGLEDYVKGVLFHEISHRWPIEAIKAQAIATRTYALYHAQMNKAKPYDVSSDIYSQVYGGKDSERYRTNKAVELTRGLVLKYKGKIFPAYFHATCAGRTENADELWNINLGCLKSVDCPYCGASLHIKWDVTLTLAEIVEKLNLSGYNIGPLKDMRVLKLNDSGRVKALELISDEGQKIISGKEFRQMLDPKIIRSLKFSLDVMAGKAFFSGFGWGHGVGMCQWGAYFMAKDGYKYYTILKFYYQDAEIEDIYEAR